MTRLVAREIAVQIIFGSEMSDLSAVDYSNDFLSKDRFEALRSENDLYLVFPDKKSLKYIMDIVSAYNDNKCFIDSIISKYAKGWKLNRISSTALAVMRVAVCEMLYIEDVPNAVAINSAVEIDKKYDDADVVSFVNGVLGSVADNI